MKLTYVVLVSAALLVQLASVNCSLLAAAGAVTSIIGSALDIADVIVLSSKHWVVEVHNEGRHDAHLWCASADNRIGNEDGIWVKPGDKLSWDFHRYRTTQFWCTMDWNGQRVGWDVYVTNWKEAPNPTKWSIRDDGVYDQWRNRRWRDLRS